MIDLEVANVFMKVSRSDGESVPKNDLLHCSFYPSWVFNLTKEVAQDVGVDVAILLLLSRTTAASYPSYLLLLG